MKNAKKVLICIVIAAVLFLVGFFTGKASYTKLSRTDRADELITSLTGELTDLRSELETRIEECERLEQQLSRAEFGIDESISTARSIRAELEQLSREISSTNPIIAELRKRIIEYENTIREIEKSLEDAKRGVDK